MHITILQTGFCYTFKMISGVLLDLSGVIYVGEQALPGAIDALERLRRSGLPVRFLTNSTRAPKAALLRRLASMGVELAPEELFTPAQAACDWMSARNLSPHLLIHPNLAEDFAGTTGGEGTAVVVGDAGEKFDFASLNAAFRALMDGAAFLALAKNRIFLDSDGRHSLDAGAFVAALEFATQREARLFGKPSRDFFQAALAGTDCSLEEAVMVGDDAEADVAGALQAGVGQAVLVRTGKYVPGVEKSVVPVPTTVVDDLSAAVEWILYDGGRTP